MVGGDDMHIDLDEFLENYDKYTFLNYYNNLSEKEGNNGEKSEKEKFLQIIMHKIFYLYINKNNLLITNLNEYRKAVNISNEQILISFFNYIKDRYNKNKNGVDNYLRLYGITDTNIKKKLKSYSSSNTTEHVPMSPSEFKNK